MQAQILAHILPCFHSPIACFHSVLHSRCIVHMCVCVRVRYSNPPRHGAEIAARVLGEQHCTQSSHVCLTPALLACTRQSTHSTCTVSECACVRVWGCVCVGVGVCRRRFAVFRVEGRAQGYG